MKTFGHILFPVDFSDRSEAARPFVTSWAQRFNAKVTLLHTIQIPISAYGGADGYPLIVDVPGMEAAARQRLDRFDFAGAERIVKVGDPAYEITQYAAKNNVDLIMMPTHGYGPFRSLLLGSVAAKVLHDAHCPVWTSAHTENPSAHSEIRNVLCVIEDPDLIPSATELAQALGAKLRLIQEHVGPISQVVREAALADGADLVIIGSGKVHKTLGLLRSNAYAIIRDSPCPVLSMP
jgi:nucleotide-binding universal stress UspA family protein